MRNYLLFFCLVFMTGCSLPMIAGTVAGVGGAQAMAAYKESCFKDTFMVSQSEAVIVVTQVLNSLPLTIEEIGGSELDRVLKARSLYNSCLLEIKVSYVAPCLVRVEVKGRKQGILPAKEDAQFVFKKLSLALTELEGQTQSLAVAP
ncbi:MAG: hypothetical protein J7M03_07610 [Candidatus Desulfofervidaceae bacterium]|nr:hypothetical protein [Candidatus Desulfofervidaceae bacterium]